MMEIMNNYYESKESQKIPFGVIEKCHSTCKTCYGKKYNETKFWFCWKL